MRRVIEYLKERCSQEEIAELVKELSVKNETKENDVPRTWEEYCKNLKQGYYINSYCEIDFIEYSSTVDESDRAENVLPTKELAEAFLAMMQLMSLRQAWIKDWKPDWNNENKYKYCIACVSNIVKVLLLSSSQVSLSFPTQEMAEEFLKCFKSLIEKAKVLI